MLQSEALKIISNSISKCTLCSELAEYRQLTNGHTVPGEGACNNIMFIGEAPGKDEAASGRPFVGAAGKLLEKIILKAGWHRENVYIGNVLKCRPPNNRTPTEEEAKNCWKFLNMQIKTVNPRWIICLGKIAAVQLLGHTQDISLTSLRQFQAESGGFFEYGGKKLIVTFHPSFLLREGNEWAKQELWNDIQPAI